MNSQARSSVDIETRRDSEYLDFRMLFEECPDALLVVEPNLKISLANHAAQELFGGSNGKLNSASLAEIVHPADQAMLTMQELSKRDGRQQTGSRIRLTHSTGIEKLVEISVRVFGSGSVNQQILLSCRDISEQNSRLEQATQLAYVDSLTGLSNLRRFDEVMDRELKLSERAGRSFSLLLLDLDHLKQINDTHGHLAGNQAICRLAEALRQQCRGSDIAGRFGGDEFYLVLPETNMSEALSCAERLRTALALEKEAPVLSASMGVATYPADGTTRESLTEAADAALYRAKRNRKDQRTTSRAQKSRQEICPPSLLRPFALGTT